MPKALSKSKHGRRAGASAQPLDQPYNSGQVLPSSGSADVVSGQKDSCKSHKSHASISGHVLPSSVPAEAGSGQKDSGKSHKSHKSTLTSSKLEKRRDRALNKICDRACSHLTVAASATETPLPLPGISADQPPTPEQLSLCDCPLTISAAGLWGSAEDRVSVTPGSPHVPRDTIQNPLPTTTPVCHILEPEQIQQMITAAVQQSLAQLPTNRQLSVRGCPSISLDSNDPEDSLSAAGPDSPSTSHFNYDLGEDATTEPDLSDDEGLPPEQPAFTGLFPQALFKSLLYKAVNTAQLGPAASEPPPTSAHGTLDPLFAEPIRAVTSIPTPPLFLDVLKKQWTSPGSAPLLSPTDRRNFNVADDLASLLQVPSIDAPIAALLPTAPVPGSPDEGLRPDERRSDLVLQRAHLGAAWAIRSASTASFFNRSTLLWLRHLQDTLSPGDPRIKQDLNKIIAAVQFSADATLNAARFAAKSLASSVTARRLVWLRHWQADARHKWRLASVPFTGGALFGEHLNPFLIETKDKRKVLPTVYRRGEPRFFPYPQRQLYRGYDGGGPSTSFSSRPSGNFYPKQRGYQDRSFRGRPPLGKRPFRGGGGRPFRRRR